MISSVNGILKIKDHSFVVIECGGIGFKCFITDNTYSKIGNIGEQTFLYTYLSVKEDALDLFGFSSVSEHDMFKLITGVSGVGPKIGLALLSSFTPENIQLFIASSDAKSLTAASGVGIKLAQRIVLELKDKVGSVSSGEISAEISNIGNAVSIPNTKEAIMALTSLGYSQSEASLAVGRLDPSLSVNDLIKQALKSLARGI